MYSLFLTEIDGGLDGPVQMHNRNDYFLNSSFKFYFLQQENFKAVVDFLTLIT